MDRQKILLADDDPEIREVLRLLLTSEGYETAEAYDGEAGSNYWICWMILPTW